MQLKKKINLRTSLAAATCSLLGASPAAKVHAEEATPWVIDTAALYYGEQDGRVQDLSANILANKEFMDGQFLNLSLAIDTLTGATPNGAKTAANTAQTFTTPSGNSSYTIKAGDLPLDDTFHDTRVALGVNWQQPVGNVSTIDIGATLSKEFDYQHLGVNASFSRDFLQRNTTLTAGLAFASDSIDPEGGAPIPLAPMLGIDDDASKRGDDSKEIIDLLIGITQVINRRMLVQFNYTYSDANGYLNDPYKIFSVLDAAGEPVLVNGPGTAPSHLFLYESRPDSRAKHSLFAKTKYRFKNSTLSASYRYMTDDWEIDSHTFDFRYRWDVSRNNYIEPHLRFYTQSAADFYSLALNDADPIPQYASADYRLGEFDGITIGAKYGRLMKNGDEWSTRLEYYTTTGTGVSSADYPDLDAIIFQVSYRLKIGD
jgi:hypothetical protein